MNKGKAATSQKMFRGGYRQREPAEPMEPCEPQNSEMAGVREEAREMCDKNRYLIVHEMISAPTPMHRVQTFYCFPTMKSI